MNGWFRDGCRDGELSPDDRAMAYGDGLFETIAVRHGEPRFARFHVERLQVSAMRLGLPVVDEQQLKQFIDVTTEQSSNRANGTLKLIYSRGESQRGYRYQAVQQPHIWTKFWEESELPERDSSGLRAAFAPMTLSRQSHLAGMKHLNRLEQITGPFPSGVDELLFRDTRGSVICGSMCNVFFVLENRFCTPALSHSGVAGVARRWILATCHRLGWPVTIADFDAAIVSGASEVFVSNSRFLVKPVVALASQRWAPGPIYLRLRELLTDERII